MNSKKYININKIMQVSSCKILNGVQSCPVLICKTGTIVHTASTPDSVYILAYAIEGYDKIVKVYIIERQKGYT